MQVISANIDQLVAMLADRADEIQALGIKGCLDVLEFEFGPAVSASPHGVYGTATSCST